MMIVVVSPTECIISASSITHGAVPDGAVPDSAVPEGAVPEGAVPDGAVPDSAVIVGDNLTVEVCVLAKVKICHM